MLGQVNFHTICRQVLKEWVVGNFVQYALYIVAF